MPSQVPLDGVHALVPREKMTESARRLRDNYARVPGAPFYKREFGWYVMDRWKREGHVKEGQSLDKLFDFDEYSKHDLGELGWCEAAFMPEFEVKVVEDRGEHEVVQDNAGRLLLCFKGRRSGFMPEYMDHPVKDMETWKRDVKWRLDPEDAKRVADLEARMAAAKADAAKGFVVCQNVIGAYMYLRSLIGPEKLLYAFYDMPDLIHDCMRAWFELADAVIATHQKHVTIDEIYFGEDICYNHGPLISPAMIAEFLMPYYRELVANFRKRQIDKARHLYLQIDTDGFAVPVIPIYRELGMDVMSPFEVASGCDVVKIGRDNPWLAMFGGIDKRVLAAGKRAIDKHLEYILPTMRARGGYYPTCDHGVPEEVSFEDYVYYRKRAVELGG
jgi:hypothetical protein